MPITPFTTPLKTEYKPLGLDKFFTSLSQMQSKYDVAKTAIDDSKFKLARMAQDDPSVAPILEDLNKKTEELSQNLVRTGNYREAAKKLELLNKTYAEDKGIQAYKSSYDNYNEWLTAQEKRVGQEKDGITQEQLDLAKYQIQNSWKGTTYNSETDRYNILSPTSITKDMEEEFRKEALTLANMVKANKTDEFTAVVDQYGDSQMLKTTIENKELPRIQEEISNFLANSDKYKHWVEDLARKRFFKAHNESKKAYQLGQATETEADKIVASSLKTLDKGINAATAAGNEEAANALQKVKNDINKTIALNDINAYEQLAENLAVQQAMGKFNNVARDAADLVDQFKLSRAYTTTDGKDGKKRQEEFDKIGTLSVSAAPISPNATLNVQEGTTPFMVEENKLAEVEDPFLGAKNLYEELKDENDGPLAVKTKKAQAMTQYLKTFKAGYDNLNQSRIDEIVSLKNAIASSEIPEEKEMYKTQIKQISEAMNESAKSYESQIKPLKDLLNSGEFAIHNQSEEIKKLYDAAGKDPVKFLNSVERLVEEKQEREFVPYNNEMFAEGSGSFYGSQDNPWPGTYEEDPDMVSSYAARENNMDSTDVSVACGPLNAACQEAQIIKNQNYHAVESFRERYGVLPSSAMGEINERNYVNEGQNKYGVDLLSEYTKQITVDGDTYTLPMQISMDENFNILTNKAAERVSSEFSKQRGNQRVPANVYNSTTGELIPIVNGSESVYIEYQTDYYDWDKGYYVGNDSQGIPVFKYPIKTDKNTDAAGRKTNEQLFNTLMKRAVDPDKITQINLGAGEMVGFKKNNPDYIYLSGAGFNMADEVLTKSRDYLLNGIKLAKGQVGSENYENTIETTLNNYAPLWLIQKPSRRSQYVTAAENLQKKQQAKIASDNVVQGPAVWKRLDDNVYQAYQVSYPTDEGGNLYRKVIKVFGVENSNGEIIVDPTKNEQVGPASQIITSQLALVMAKDAITYGVGNDADIPVDKNRNPIVIAHMLGN